MNKTFQINKWKIETLEKDFNGKPAFVVRIYNTNATTYNQLKQNYAFRTEEARNKYIMDFVNKHKAYEQSKVERKAQRKAQGRNTEETTIIKKALAAKYGYKNVKVVRGKGTAYGWVTAHVQLNEKAPACEMCPDANVWKRCYQCSDKWSAARQEVYKTAKAALVEAGLKFNTWYGDDDYAKEEFNYDISYAQSV